MKKLIVFVLTLFIGLINAKAMNPTVEYITSIYANKMGDKLYSGQLGYIKVDGKIIYCIDPYRIIGNNYYVDNNTNIKKEDIIYMQSVANAASKYLSQSNKAYMSAQELIWERLIGTGKISWTSELNGNGYRIGLDNYKTLIQNEVINLTKKPSFDNTYVQDKFFSRIVLEDTNNVLKEYKIVQNKDSKNNVYIDDNKLYIEILSDKLDEIKLVKNVGKDDLKIYTNGGSNQVLADLNTSFEVESSVKIKATNENNSNLDIHFIDSETKELIKDNIEFTLNDDNYSTANGKFFINLKTGNYKVNLVNVPKNYAITKEYNIDIKDDNPIENRCYYVEIDRAMGKVYFKDDGYDILNLYNKKGDLIKEFYEDTSIIVPFDKYYVTDENNNVLKRFELEYKDQYTQYVEKEILLSKKEMDSKKEKVSKKEVKLMKQLPNTYNYISYIKFTIILLMVYVFKS